MKTALRTAVPALPALAAAVLLTACQTTTADSVKPHVSVVRPAGAAAAGPAPVVFFLQGTGGGNNRAWLWASTLADAGIASAIIDGAGLRNRSNLAGVPARDVAQDYAAALRLLRDDPRVDVGRHAVMGFSSGGTAAMVAGTVREPDQPRPRAVIAFYPGVLGECSENHAADTAVHVFYGDLDEWGTHGGTRDACRRAVEGKPGRVFHAVRNAHHGFDDSVTVTWSAGGYSFRSEPNPQARAEVAQTLIPLLKAAFR
ncbi:dienelactone hydrolase family protein [Azospirillum halopraeferens]|uniref:dienelactone hydrolase family protein n=1 Tax=Azospirillum halopraeferens TaxID=34010 RepID=UPI000491870E|nr:dienelactone hydrolase family protein [Azospirillum halopraeferens]